MSKPLKRDIEICNHCRSFERRSLCNFSEELERKIIVNACEIEVDSIAVMTHRIKVPDSCPFLLEHVVKNAE